MRMMRIVRVERMVRMMSLISKTDLRHEFDLRIKLVNLNMNSSEFTSTWMTTGGFHFFLSLWRFTINMSFVFLLMFFVVFKFVTLSSAIIIINNNNNNNNNK